MEHRIRKLSRLLIKRDHNASARQRIGAITIHLFWSAIFAASVSLPVPAAASSSSIAPVLAYYQDCYPIDLSAHRTVVIVIDGLRADYVTPTLMPNLYSLGQSGVFADAHTAAFPSKTYVNSASIATGAYPARHGLLGNEMYVPGKPGADTFSTGTAENLEILHGSSKGPLFTTTSLSEKLPDCLFVTGSQGSGAALLMNHEKTGKGIWTAGGFYEPQSGKQESGEINDGVSEIPKADCGGVTEEECNRLDLEQDALRTDWAFGVYLHHALSDNPPAVTVLWIHEADGAGHDFGVGSQEVKNALSNIDSNIGWMMDEHEANDLDDKINIIVTADHGFSNRGDSGFKIDVYLTDNDLTDKVIVADGRALYVDEDDPAEKLNIIRTIVQDMQLNSGVGNIYTAPYSSDSERGIVPGTLSFNAIQWNHERSGDIIFAPNWSSANHNGFPGDVRIGGQGGSHGSDSPYDMRIRLVAAGPDFKQGVRSSVPSGNVDIAPTVLHLAGIDPPTEMDGRVLLELLRDGPSPASVPFEERTLHSSVNIGNILYAARMDIAIVGSTVYMRGSRPLRTYIETPPDCPLTSQKTDANPLVQCP